MNAKLLVDHVDTLGILCDCPGFTAARTFAALNTGTDCEGLVGLLDDLDACFGHVINFIKGCGTRDCTLETCLAKTCVLHFKSFHQSSGSIRTRLTGRELSASLLSVYIVFRIPANMVFPLFACKYFGHLVLKRDPTG